LGSVRSTCPKSKEDCPLPHSVGQAERTISPPLGAREKH
ncbi:hypothetical protein T4E_6409, partial [Trichinella pseudospiralis]